MILLFDRRYIQLRQVYGFYTFLLNETKIAPNVLLFCLSVCVDKPSVYVILAGSWFRYTVACLKGNLYMGFGPYHFGPITKKYATAPRQDTHVQGIKMFL